MDFGSLASLVSAFALGWFARCASESPPLERPCSCACACHCVSNWGFGIWAFGLVFLAIWIISAGVVIFFWVSSKRDKVSSPQGSSKGKKGILGVTGKVLSLTD